MPDGSELAGVAASARDGALVVGVRNAEDHVGSGDELVWARWHPSGGWGPTQRQPLGDELAGYERQVFGGRMVARGVEDAWFMWNASVPEADVSLGSQVHVAHWDGVMWQEYPLRRAGVVVEGKDIALDGSGDVWLGARLYEPGSEDYGPGAVFRLSGGAWRRADRGLPSVVKDDVPWRITARGHRVDLRMTGHVVSGIDGRWSVRRIADVTDHPFRPRDIHRVPEGLVLAGSEAPSSHGAAFVFDGDRWRPFNEGLPSAGGYLDEMAGPALDRLWAWGNHGDRDAFVRTAAGWQRFDAPIRRGFRAFEATFSSVAPTAAGAFAVGGDGIGIGVYRLCSIALDPSAVDPVRISVAASVSAIYVRIPTDAAQPNRLLDASPLSSFDSGELQPGDRYVARVPGAGTYPLTDGSARDLVLAVAPQVWQAERDLEAPLRVVWGEPDLPTTSYTPYRWDVEIRGPGETRFRTLVRGADEVRGRFAADLGPGRYVIRARTVNIESGAGSAWSPVRSVTIG